MKKLKHSQGIAEQSNKPVRKSQKHDANLQKNSTLYFQIGLILCLLATYSIFEMEFETKSFTIEKLADTDDFDQIIVKPFVVEPDQKVVQKPQKQAQRLLAKVPVIIDDHVDVKNDPIELVKPVVLSKPASVGSIENIEKPVDDIELPFNMIDVERVPIYPGCEKATSNQERVKCMSQKLARLIQRKFNTDLAVDLGLSGLQKIDVQFKIDKSGRITDIKTRAPFDQLEKEAERVVQKIPDMTPGMQRDEPVSVLYYLPIKFQVR